jgi:hypothetical protein
MSQKVEMRSAMFQSTKILLSRRKLNKARMVNQIEEKIMVEQTDRGNVIEHFSISGIKTNGQDPFVAAYTQIRDLDERLVGLVDAVDSK